MKNKFIKILIIATLIISCQKNFTVEPSIPTPDQILTNDSTLLSLYVVIDTTAPQNLDTLSKATYSYDAQKRLTKYDWIDYTNGVISSPVSLRWKNLFFYNGNDTLPYKEIDSTYELGNITTETIYHTYFNGKVLLDSSSTGFIIRYTYLPLKTVDTLIFYNSLTPPFVRRHEYRVTYRQYTNNNLILQKDSVFTADYTSNPFTYSFNFVDTRTATHNSFLNPSFKFRNITPFGYDGYFLKLNDFESQSKNTLTDFVQVTRGASGTIYDFDDNQTISYIYNLNGYPKIARTKSLLDPLVFSKAYYYYTN